MEQLIKLFLATIFLFNLCCCKPTKKYQGIVFKEVIEKSGYILYDWRNTKAYLIEDQIDNVNLLTEAKIKGLIKDAEFSFLLRRGLLDKKQSSYLSLHLCEKKERIIVEKKGLLLNNYFFKKVENIPLYKVEGMYKNKIRLAFCNNE